MTPKYKIYRKLKTSCIKSVGSRLRCTALLTTYFLQSIYNPVAFTHYYCKYLTYLSRRSLISLSHSLSLTHSLSLSLSLSLSYIQISKIKNIKGYSHFTSIDATKLNFQHTSKTFLGLHLCLSRLHLD